jgi:hypothetical protein
MPKIILSPLITVLCIALLNTACNRYKYPVEELYTIDDVGKDTTLPALFGVGDYYDPTCQIAFLHWKTRKGHLKIFVEYSPGWDTLGVKPFPVR